LTLPAISAILKSKGTTLKKDKSFLALLVAFFLSLLRYEPVKISAATTELMNTSY
jgi:hypothetical protein